MIVKKKLIWVNLITVIEQEIVKNENWFEPPTIQA